MTAVITVAIGGQPGMFTTGLSFTSSDIATAPVGFGCAAGRPP